jgi:2-polyprenyl-3-methyl-5-hydroxy-6-metoxy-1,4-benzoquinol methylase
MKNMMGVEPWCLDSVKVGKDTIEISGWAIPPKGDHSRVSFTVNDCEFDHVEFPINGKNRQDIEKLFWYIPNSGSSAFYCKTKISEKDSNFLTFKYVDRKKLKSLKREHDNFFCLSGIDHIGIPDSDRRSRVHGDDSLSAFLLEGFSTYKKLELALQQVLSKGFNDYKRILDWGCGCGRVTRYFHNHTGNSITGIDIDSDNIDWCRQNLPFGQFMDIPLCPPTALEADSYDLLIGISIFTHLKEKVQFEWLDELGRIASDGATLLLTVHSNSTVCRAGLCLDHFREWRKQGFLDAGANPNLDQVIQGSDYYRNTFHTRKYIKTNWSKFFKIVKIIPGYIGNHQDLVILRK